MKLETIRKDKKKHIIIVSMIVLSVVGCLTLTTTRAKYRSVQSLKLASGIVKINSYDFKIVAMKQSEDGKNYTDINIMPETGYVINEDKSYCTTDNKTQVKGKLKTVNGNHVMIGLNKNDKCYLWFDKYIVPITIPDIIAAIEASSSFKGGTPTFTSVATGAETEDNNGIYKVGDGMYGGSSYYWRGAATTNHVIFDSKCWRIVRINGDNTIRLIYNGTPSGTTCPGNGPNASSVVLKGTAYNLKQDNSSYVGWTYSVGIQRPSAANPQTSGTAALIKTALENWYSNNMSSTSKNKVVAGKFCNDRNTQNNETWRATGAMQYYAAYARNYNSSSAKPTLSCSNGDVYLLDIGMITADEVTFAGASGTTSNTSYYLYNGQIYWTMSPFNWHSNGYVNIFAVRGSDGSFDWFGVNSTSYSVRPVINLRSDVTFNSGSDGTQNNPYIVQ